MRWAESAIESAIAAFTGRPPSGASHYPSAGPDRGSLPATTLGTAIEEIRSLIAADGGDMLLVSADDTTVNLELVVTDAHCAECVMPRPYLERLCLDIVQRSAPGYTLVHITDPRESK